MTTTTIPTNMRRSFCDDSEAHATHRHVAETGNPNAYGGMETVACPGVICFSSRVHKAHGSCAGLDADTLFERTQDAAQ